MAEFQSWDIEKINPYDKNPRINEKAVEEVLKSLKEHGQIRPLVLSAPGAPFSESVLCCGHTTLKALQKHGAKKVKVQVVPFKDEAQFVRYNIQDNKTSEYAMWDELILEDLSKELKIDLGELGFDIDFDFEEKPPEEFELHDDKELIHRCPKCGFEFNG